MTLTLRYAVRSDLGLVRGNNEDSVYAGPRLLAIADGMGGHAAGEVASKIVISTMEPLDDDTVRSDLIAALRDAVLDGNQRIADAVVTDPELDGMGTTLTALRFSGTQVALVHVGDSRAYLVRGDQLTQITHDDTYVQYLVDSGKLTADEAKDHPRKSVILRALRGADVEPDVSIRESRAGDRYLLCSDGLSDVVSTETIFETLRIRDPQESADRLVELALRSGGPDNVTVIVADVVDSRPGDVVDDVPVRDGAFVDPRAAEVLPSDSAAERAAAMSRPAASAEPAAAAEVPRRRRSWKIPLIIVAVLLVLGGGLGGTYAWAQTQYYVGRSGDTVAIFRGVDAAVGPIHFSDVYRLTGIRMSDLTPVTRSQVESGITASSRSDAQVIVTRLMDHRKPECGPGGQPSGTTSGAPGSTSSGSASPGTNSPGGTSPGGTSAGGTSAGVGQSASGSTSDPSTGSSSGARTSAPGAGTPSRPSSTSRSPQLPDPRTREVPTTAITRTVRTPVRSSAVRLLQLPTAAAPSGSDSSSESPCRVPR